MKMQYVQYYFSIEKKDDEYTPQEQDQIVKNSEIEKKLQKILSQFAHKRDWEQFHNLKNLAISINIESSELLEIFQWKKEDEIKLDLKKKLIKEKISDEVADIMLYLLRFSDLAKIDIEKCCLEKIRKNEKKYPVSLSKGKSTKYNLLKK